MALSYVAIKSCIKTCEPQNSKISDGAGGGGGGVLSCFLHT